MKKEESFEKIKGESFYTSPPYAYRPSVAEYLTTFTVTKRGFLADVLHLDYKKNIKILSFEKDHLLIKLNTLDDLNKSEMIIWEYFYSLKNYPTDDIIKFYPKKIPFSTMLRFNAIVRLGVEDKFKQEDINVFFREDFQYNSGNYSLETIKLYMNCLAFGILSYVIGFIGLLTAVILSALKLSKSHESSRFFIKRFAIKFIAVYFICMIFLFMSAIGALFIMDSSKTVKFFYILSLIPLFVFLFAKYCKLTWDFIRWVNEGDEAKKHREDWLSFKSFIYKNSLIREKPLAHYKLWDQFYYYALATGAIDDPYKLR